MRSAHVISEHEGAGRTYPTISATIWWDLRHRLRRSVPDRIDAEFLQAVLAVGERHAKYLVRQLHAIGLIDATEAPTGLAARWKDDEAYPAVCRQILTETYPPALRDAYPAPTPDKVGVARWFEQNADVGKAAATKLASFYGLLAAGDPTGWRVPGSLLGQANGNPVLPDRRSSSVPRASWTDPSAERWEARPGPDAAKTDRGYARVRNRYLARRWFVVALAMLVGGLAGLGWAASRPDAYVAQTAVIPTESDIPADQLGGVAGTAFSTDTVLLPVIARLGLQTTPEELLSSGALHAESVPSGPALLITGRSTDPRQAEDLANAATESFVEVAERKGLGVFAPFGNLSPATPLSHETGLRVVLGMLAGAVIALLALAVTFSVRDPITGEHDARSEASPDASFGLAVTTRRHHRDDDAEPPNDDARNAVWPHADLVTLREILHQDAGDDGPAGAVTVTGSDADWAAVAVARELEIDTQSTGSDQEPSGGFAVASSDPGLAEFLGSRETVVTIVPAGTPRRSLRRVEDELRALGTRSQILVFVDPFR